jgi:hypothetical protein
VKGILSVVFALILCNVFGQAIFKNEILDSLKKENVDTIALFEDHCTYMGAYVGQCPLFIQWKKNGKFFMCRYMDRAKYEIKIMNESSTQIEKYIQLQSGLKYDSLQMTKLHKNDRFTQYPCDDCTSAYSIAYILGCRQVHFQIEYMVIWI